MHWFVFLLYTFCLKKAHQKYQWNNIQQDSISSNLREIFSSSSDKISFFPVVWRLRAFNLLKYVIPSFILAVEAFSSPSFIKNLMSDSIWIFCFLLFYTSLSNNFLSSPLLAASFFRYCLYYCLAHLAEESMSFNIGTFSTPTIAYHSMAALSMANKSYLICLYLD